jgi:hypothetical protein
MVLVMAWKTTMSERPKGNGEGEILDAMKTLLHQLLWGFDHETSPVQTTLGALLSVFFTNGLDKWRRQHCRSLALVVL